MKNINFLIALDLDGTSVRYDPILEMEPELIDYITKLAEDAGFAWVMNSDRFTETMNDIAMLLHPAQMPCALLSCQRFIHLLDGENRYTPFSSWNKQQLIKHKKLWDIIAPNFEKWAEVIEQRFKIVDKAINDIVFAYMVNSEKTYELRRLMKEFISDYPEAQVSGNHDWSFILQSSFSKRSVLLKCAEVFGVKPENIIAVGDGLNDITMLDGSVTQMTGCPANASCEVKKAVKNTGGYIAEESDAKGTLQVIKYFVKKQGIA